MRESSNSEWLILLKWIMIGQWKFWKNSVSVYPGDKKLKSLCFHRGTFLFAVHNVCNACGLFFKNLSWNKLCIRRILFFSNSIIFLLQEKETRFNSGNYIGLRIKYVATNNRTKHSYRNSMLANLHCGIQKSRANIVHLIFISVWDMRWTLTIMRYHLSRIDFKFSYVFFNSKSKYYSSFHMPVSCTHCIFETN